MYLKKQLKIYEKHIGINKKVILKKQNTLKQISRHKIQNKGKIPKMKNGSKAIK